MADTIAVQPDLEARVWDQIKDLPGVTSWSYTVLSDFPTWQRRFGLQVDVRASSKTAACARAETVRQRMAQLAGDPWSAGVVSYVQPTDGPFWLPDADGCPRYVTRYEVRCHPAALVPASSRAEARRTA
jgi:hypothetical protein